MTIQINTDKTINGNERHQDFFAAQIAQALDNYQSHITKIEAHLSDQNGNKKGWDDIQCLLEAGIEGRQPVVVKCQANTIESAMSGAIDKLKAALATILGHLQNHHQ